MNGYNGQGFVENSASVSAGNEQAVVIGAGIAGLVTARVLAEHFAQVLVIERDCFPEENIPRKGAPQGQHIHILLARGRAILEEMFPGLQDELRAAGAPLVDITDDIAILGPAGWAVPTPSTLTSRACTRPLIESHIRTRVQANPRIRFHQGCEVVGLLNGANRQVIGVHTRARGAQAGKQADIEAVRADLVVDASGRTSRAPQWLQERGYPTPAETVINSFTGYATVTVEPPSNFQPNWKGLYMQAAPPTYLRGGAIWPVEGKRWLITLIGMSRDYPPTDEAGFLAFAHSLRTPLFYQVLQKSRPLSPIVGYRATENRVRHYERMNSWPDGFVALGDAACAFNPVYGQGMTIAAMGAQVLDACLHQQHRRKPYGDRTGMSRRFQRQLARSNATAWKLAIGPDMRAPGAEGARPSWIDRLMYRYLDRLFLQTTIDGDMTRALFEVLQLSKPPSALFHPRIVASLLRSAPKPAPQTEVIRAI